MRWWLGLLAAVALVVAACGGGDDGPSDATAAANFDPDANDLTSLISWGRADSLIVVRDNLSAEQQALFAQLMASELPGLDKYVVDLAAFPNPYRLQVISYLRARFETAPFSTVYDFPEIFNFDPSDSDTDAYIAFKQALFAGQYTDMAAMMDASFPRTIDVREVLWGGVEVDGIPPLEFPDQVRPEEAVRWINDTDEVIGVAINGDVRAYPIRIISWHEMVNDTIGGVPVSLTYCTLCGSAILYDGRVGGEVYRFGTSGLLYRSNKLMYDRTSRTLWNQFTGEPAWGPLVGAGIRLTSMPVVYTTWGEWLAANPETTVLNIKTGFTRDYGPGGAYAEYTESDETIFRVPVEDDRLAPKAVVYVVRLDATLAVYPTERLAALGFVQETVDGTALVVVATGDGAGGRAYASAGVEFVGADPAAGTLRDADGGTWALEEDGLRGPAGRVLARLSGHNAFWFAIANQTPEATLFEG
ncbi:MAG: Protein of unknown function (DUF3179) [Chloroflexi bacterium]|nr:MAG: Protein of unknown function (DUF3179) [Chloroflexota bacterium]